MRSYYNFFFQDVIGVIKEETPLRDYLNDNQEPKKQKKYQSLMEGVQHSFWTYLHYSYDLNAFIPVFITNFTQQLHH